jgi:hypothetical protein
MKWAALALVVLLVGGGAASYALSRPDLTCPGAVTASTNDGVSTAATPEDATGTLLDDADRVTRERDDAKGFQTVTFRGYDAQGELLSRVVVEGNDRSWRTARVDTCG